MTKPLEGYKVIEIGQEIQGPFAGKLLADLGASVVKVENPRTGDLSRWMLTSMIGGPEVNNPQVSAYFIAMNQGKRSITLDLKTPGAVEVVRRMAASYDVLITNYRHGVLDRLGLGYEELSRINPKLIYAQGSSWGPKGPWVTRPSRDTLAQAASGLMAKTGMPDDLPLPAGIMAADHSGGLSLAARNFRGTAGARAHRQGPDRWTCRSMARCWRCRDLRSITCRSRATRPSAPATAIRFCAACGAHSRPATATYVWPGWMTGDGPGSAASWGSSTSKKNPVSTTSRATCTATACARYSRRSFRRAPLRNGSRNSTTADMLATEVADYKAVLASEQARANGYIRELEHPVAGKIKVAGNPFVINNEVESTAAVAPELGQHTEEVLLELGYSWEEIDQLRSAAVL